MGVITVRRIENDCLNARAKWNGLNRTTSASAVNKIGLARLASMYWEARFFCQPASPPRGAGSAGGMPRVTRASSWVRVATNASA